MAVLAGAAAGAAVCIFGMWAFLKGQSSIRELARGGSPVLIHRPAKQRALREGLTEQMRALFAQPDEERGESE